MNEMKSLALNAFLKFNNNSSAAKAAYSENDILLLKESKEYALFTLESKGLVIVSKDEASAPILGCSASSVSYEEMPPALKFLLSKYDATSEHASAITTSAHSAITPFVTTQWGQGSPYNDLCPEISGTKAPSGCVATALAQILNCVKNPTLFKFVGTCTVSGSSTPLSLNINDTFTYPMMDTYLSGEYTQEEGTAIAKFVRDCGYAVNMEYTADGSGSSSNYVMDAAIKNFGYSKESIKLHPKSIYSEQEWNDIIFGEMEKGYPVYYTGHNSQGGDGHAFVVCGSDDEGKVYVNWGWNGSFDGYFSMSLLKPSYDLSYYNEIVTGFHPTKLDTDVQEMIFGAPGLYSFTSDESGMHLNLPEGIWNYSNTEYTVSVCAGAENIETGDKKYANVIKTQTKYPVYYGQGAGTYDFIMSTLTEGKYLIGLYVKKQYSTTYTPVRTTGGIISYEMTVDAAGNKTIGTTPIPTPIKSVEIDEPENNINSASSNKVYNLSGQLVGLDYKGIVIQNGKKILRK